MSELIKFTVMIILSGALASLSAVFIGAPEPETVKTFILGSMLSLAIVIGLLCRRRGHLENPLQQALLGLSAGSIASVLNLLLYFPPPHDYELRYKYLPVILPAVCGAFFQAIINSRSKFKFYWLVLVSFYCSIAKFIACHFYIDPHNILQPVLFAVLNALLFVSLWYFPVWLFYTREHSFKVYLKCFQLNFRVLKLLVLKRLLSPRNYAGSYDRVATNYDSQWLEQLRPVTEELLCGLPPEIGSGDVLDLGCGTGFATVFLERHYPEHQVIGVDISAEMLDIARRKCAHTEFIKADILEFLRARPEASASLIFSSWAIGYSRPSKVIAETA
ncbi:MAG: class I SAM-dependent methyltransferase, partial [Victivallales bacterium]|nr:class I SAM-dependent methyltransferase [Victivallales bacterium]